MRPYTFPQNTPKPIIRKVSRKSSSKGASVTKHPFPPPPVEDGEEADGLDEDEFEED